MKKIMAILFLLAFVFGYSQIHAAAPYETVVASDGCVVYTDASFAQFAKDHNGQNVKDALFIQTLQHKRHAAFRN